MHPTDITHLTLNLEIQVCFCLAYVRTYSYLHKVGRYLYSVHMYIAVERVDLIDRTFCDQHSTTYEDLADYPQNLNLKISPDSNFSGVLKRSQSKF
jgi:hypothetical protein